MRSLVLLVSAVIVLASAHAAAPSTDGVAPHVGLRPSIVRLHEEAAIAVTQLHARSLQVLLDGATYPDGTPLPWRSLRLVGGVWRGSLPAPSLRGLYPVLLRPGAGAAPIRLHMFLRVFAPGTRARPSFHDPTDVVRWWVRTVPHGTFRVLKAWPRPGFDRRDVRLHRLFVVAYSPPGHPAVRDRLGMFVTAFRDGYHAPWQLLEATVEP